MYSDPIIQFNIISCMDVLNSDKIFYHNMHSPNNVTRFNKKKKKLIE